MLKSQICLLLNFRYTFPFRENVAANLGSVVGILKRIVGKRIWKTSQVEPNSILISTKLLKLKGVVSYLDASD